MTTKACKKSGRKHTPITSEKQRGLMGAALSQRESGGKGLLSSMTTEELKAHLKESKGQKLPKKVKKKQ